jgi:hypothetical protein
MERLTAIGAWYAACASGVVPLRFNFFHRNCGVDAPRPSFGGAAPELNANRADLDFYTLVFEEDTIIIASRRVLDNFALGTSPCADHSTDCTGVEAARGRRSLQLRLFGLLIKSA